MQPAVRVTRLSRIGLRVMLVVPALVAVAALDFGLTGAVSPLGAGLGVLGAVLAFACLWQGMVGKYFVLTLALLGWVMGLGYVLIALGGWVGFAIAAGAALGFTVLAFHAAVPWAADRSRILLARGRGTIEAEWISVPRDFVQTHPGYRLSFGIYFTALAVIAGAVFPVWLVPLGNVVFWPAVIYVAVTLVFMALKGAVASPLVYIGLLPGLPFTLPFMFYWADGVRPNLIYRHRFGRLCTEENSDV